jgi:hypothetical protein
LEDYFMTWRKLFFSSLLVFGLFFISACSEDDGDTVIVEQPISVSSITAVEELGAGQRLILEPVILNLPGSAEYTWSAGCGSFNDAASATPTYIAPDRSSDGSCLISLTVSDGNKIGTGSKLLNISADQTRAFAKLDGLSSATLATSGTSKAIFAADNGDGYKLYELEASTGVSVNANTISAIGANIALVSAVGTKVAILTRGTPPKVQIYDSSNLSTPSTLNADFPVSSTVGSTTYNFATLHHGEAAFALSDDYLFVGSDNETVGTYIEVYDLSGTDHGRIATSTAVGVGELVSIAAKKISGETYLILGGGGEAGGAGGTGVYKLVNGGSGDYSLEQKVAPDGKSSHWIKYNADYAIESKVNDAEVKVWEWTSGGATAKGSVKVPNGTVDATTIRALQFDSADTSIAYVASFNGGYVYKVDLSAVSGGDAAKQPIFRYPKHNGLNFMAWMIEKVTVASDDYYVLTGGYDTGGGRANPGVALVFKNPYSQDEAPISANYFSGLVRMLRIIENGGDYFYVAKDSSASKLSVNSIN